MTKTAIVALIFLLTVSAPAQDGPSASIFAPGVISGGDVFGVTFAPDGKTVYFCETDREIKHIQIMTSHLERGTWSKPVATSFSPGPYRDVDPFITADGRHLFFNSNRPPSGAGDARKDFDTFVMDKTRQGWGAPRRLDGPVNTDAMEVFVSVAHNGNLYFASDRPGGKGSNDLYVARRFGKGYAAPEDLSDINTDGSESNPLIAPDESYLIFSSRVNEHGDLFVSFRDGEHWSKPQPLGAPVNTEDDEYAPAISPDGKSLYFTRTRSENGKRTKPGVIYSVRIADLHFEKMRAKS